MTIEVRGEADPDLSLISRQLEQFTQRHSDAVVTIYRQSSVSVRIRIITPAFASQSRAERIDVVWKILENLDEQVSGQISVLLLLTPEEATRSFANFEFDDPVPSGL